MDTLFGTFVFRRSLRKAYRETNDPAEKAKLKSILADPDLFSDVFEAVKEQIIKNEGVTGPFADLIKWMIENSDKVVAFIMAILPLFV